MFAFVGAWAAKVSISSTFLRVFFVQNFGAKAKTSLEKLPKRNFRTKNARVKR
jgi:hypothetical protein